MKHRKQAQKQALLKAIIERWGVKVAENLKERWSPVKEREYLEQLREVLECRPCEDRVVENGISFPKKLFKRDKQQTCSSCGIYSLKMRDALYLNKFGTCQKCYILENEDRK